MTSLNIDTDFADASINSCKQYAFKIKIKIQLNTRNHPNSTLEAEGPICPLLLQLSNAGQRSENVLALSLTVSSKIKSSASGNVSHFWCLQEPMPRQRETINNSEGFPQVSENAQEK